MPQTPPSSPGAPPDNECPQCQALREENARLRARIEELETRPEELERASHRPAAPFGLAEDQRAQDPKRPGRQAGHPGSYRARPGWVDEEIEVPLARCPACGEPVTCVERVEQYIAEIPEPARPRGTRRGTYRGYCRRCGEEVVSRPPIQVSDATGAAGTHLGAGALARAAELRHGLGLTVRKTGRVLKRCGGLEVTPGGLAQALARVGTRLEGAYRDVAEQVRTSPVVYADETSGWVGGPGHWLWVFTTPEVTRYRIEPGRGKDVVFDTRGEQFAGRPVSDCLASYDAIACKKHKWYAHRWRALGEARRRLPDSRYLRQLRILLMAAKVLGELRGALPDFPMRRQALETSADRLLYPARNDPTEARVANRLRKQRAHLFGFLDEPGGEPTHNRAERQLRPAVIARKLSCGNKTVRGKRTAEILMSLAATAQQQGLPLSQRIVPALGKAAWTGSHGP